MTQIPLRFKNNYRIKHYFQKSQISRCERSVANCAMYKESRQLVRPVQKDGRVTSSGCGAQVPRLLLLSHFQIFFFNPRGDIYPKIALNLDRNCDLSRGGVGVTGISQIWHNFRLYKDYY